MFCSKCGRNNADTARFCAACGKPLAPDTATASSGLKSTMGTATTAESTATTAATQLRIF